MQVRCRPLHVKHTAVATPLFPQPPTRRTYISVRVGPRVNFSERIFSKLYSLDMDDLATADHVSQQRIHILDPKKSIFLRRAPLRFVRQDERVLHSPWLLRDSFLILISQQAKHTTGECSQSFAMTMQIL